jgi:RHS repeat-associated protein
MTGRWMSQDPIGFAGGDANLYRYVRNAPNNFRVPSRIRG